MIVVLDSNVFVSSLLARQGHPVELITRWEGEQFDLATSPKLLDELARALACEQVRKYFKLPDEKISALLKRFRAAAFLVRPPTTPDVISEDPQDNKVLACAQAVGAAYIVTGDSHLLQFKENQGIIILPPAGFLAILRIGEKRGRK